MGQDVPVALNSFTDIMRDFVKSRTMLLARLDVVMIVGYGLTYYLVLMNTTQSSQT